MTPSHPNTHTLRIRQGFSPSLFPLFPNGDPRAPVAGPYGAATLVKSPKVAEVARAHFGCASLQGAFLEDEGTGGSSGAHWEARTYQGELMLPSSPYAGRTDKLPRLALTMALLEDSGWYVPNWSEVPPLDFGKGAGCGFVRSRADTFVAANPRQPWFCRSNATLNVCTFDHEAIAECFKAGAAPAGQPTNFLNGVPVAYAVRSAANCRAPGPGTTLPALAGQTQAAASLCFEIAAPPVDASGTKFVAGAGCWEAACAGGRLSLVFRFPDGEAVRQPCPEATTLDLAALMPRRFQSGAVECPRSAALACASLPGACGACETGSGTCGEGRCRCALTHTGPDCGTHVLQVDDWDARLPLPADWQARWPPAAPARRAPAAAGGAVQQQPLQAGGRSSSVQAELGGAADMFGARVGSSSGGSSGGGEGGSGGDSGSAGASSADALMSMLQAQQMQQLLRHPQPPPQAQAQAQEPQQPAQQQQPPAAARATAVAAGSRLPLPVKAGSGSSTIARKLNNLQFVLPTWPPQGWPASFG